MRKNKDRYVIFALIIEDLKVNFTYILNIMGNEKSPWHLKFAMKLKNDVWSKLVPNYIDISLGI